MSTEEFQYDANGLLDHLLQRCSLKNDAALARHFQVAPPVISKLRHSRLPVGDSFVIRCIELGGLTLPEVRAFVPSPYVGGV